MSEAGLTADMTGRTVFGADGERLGELVDLYADTKTGAVTFAGVAMIRRGRRRTVSVSLSDAGIAAGSVTVQWGKELARRAPSVRMGQALPADAEPALFSYLSSRTHGRRLVPCR